MRLNTVLQKIKSVKNNSYRLPKLVQNQHTWHKMNTKLKKKKGTRYYRKLEFLILLTRFRVFRYLNCGPVRYLSEN